MIFEIVHVWKNLLAQSTGEATAHTAVLPELEAEAHEFSIRLARLEEFVAAVPFAQRYRPQHHDVCAVLCLSNQKVTSTNYFWDNKNLITEGNSPNLGNPGAEDHNVV